MEKSYVSLEQKVCPICGHKHDVGVLLDRRLKDSLEPKTVTGFKPCNECQTRIDDKYVAFVEVSNQPANDNTMQMSDAERTGRIAWVRQRVCDNMLDVKITTPIVFVEPAVIEHLHSLSGE